MLERTTRSGPDLEIQAALLRVIATGVVAEVGSR